MKYKNYITSIILLLISSIMSGQEDTKKALDFSTSSHKEAKEKVSLFTVNRVKEMAIYPGCELYKGNKKALMKCFSEKLTYDIIRYLDTEFPAINKERVVAQLEFHVTTTGEITNISVKRGDNIFKAQAKEALEKAANYLKIKGKKIEPATMADGSKATLIFNNNIVLRNPNY